MGRAAAPDPSPAPKLLVAGSIALDTLEGGFGRVDEELGGSALYFALAASLVGPVRMLAPVGRDAEAAVRAAIRGRPIDAALVDVLDAPTYRWHARAVAGGNRDLGSRDSIYDRWSPHPPAGFQGWAFIGSMRPDRQLEAARRLPGAGLLAADAMLSYIAARPDEAGELLRLSSWFFANADEMAALGGHDAADFRSLHGLGGLVVKRGPDGVTAWTQAGPVSARSLVVGGVVDTTGAGDALAGGMLARWSAAGGRPEDLPEALRWGVAAASLAIEDVGVRGLLRATPDELARRAGRVQVTPAE